jgi:hypothetical protein
MYVGCTARGERTVDAFSPVHVGNPGMIWRGSRRRLHATPNSVYLIFTFSVINIAFVTNITVFCGDSECTMCRSVLTSAIITSHTALSCQACSNQMHNLPCHRLGNRM